ncbi:DNA methylase, partial [Desulfovibrio sp. OttesenSCG-928-G11]|nr:DNA methylase [Desulfovibrio sp. OttesenSCG-928-G11]
PAWINKSTGPMKGWTSGTLYIPSLQGEQNITNAFYEKLLMVIRAGKNSTVVKSAILSCSSLSQPIHADNAVDYIFLDPPFGANLNYSELNALWEYWLITSTNNKPEAIENRAQGKGSVEYRQLMASCFKEAYRALKPGRWMTVEFSNTKAAVWNTIQSALAEAGFIVANVSALDKKQGSFKAVTTPTAVKQDLVISAYKPNGGFEERFLSEADSEEGVWDFVRTHMKYLPVLKPQGNALLPVPERDPRILYDQMLAYYVRKNRPIPMNSADFQLGLAQRFLERDGMYFLPDQAAQYDRTKLIYTETAELSLFVKDEASAIQWLRSLLKSKPQTFADINPQFMQQLSGWSKNEKQLDLRELLAQNFLTYDGKGLGSEKVPEQIHAYLSSNWKEMRNLPKDSPALIDKAKDRWYVPDPNKATDLEKLRERALLKEFDNYLAQIAEQPHRKLKVFRMEAIRTGFKQAWQSKNYQTIVKVAEKIPPTVLEEDDKLLMWYDQAVTRIGGE